jgi:CelD/BcsL family acetyltransferase involved in cellulose biosynthesis
MYEPGTLIFMHMVDELAREGVRRFDFGLGEAFYKQRFGDQSWREGTVRIFAPTVKGLTLRSSLGFFRMLDAVGRHLVKKIGGLDRLKTGWRRRLASSKAETEVD